MSDKVIFILMIYLSLLVLMSAMTFPGLSIALPNKQLV